jgi:hypothetical protein
MTTREERFARAIELNEQAYLIELEAQWELKDKEKAYNLKKQARAMRRESEDILDELDRTM